ncbi:MAG: MBL fold metallo-hydrolase [Ruminococcus sp.]|uniref:MBL fold metallo-hydrolase n=1 Tax=Ruminococcus sp. TaxID=41978 RepID=UPI002872B005|nr:MBL fold metallo-hydrolase [Ruminococcus sp.]MBQ3286197.1 MBL fold metallo-hydrolase [Ruminococcus sp.]
MIKIMCFVIGMIGTNCYLIEDEATGELAVVDPADHSDRLIEEIDKRGGKLSYILLTHGHYDHITGAAELCERYHPTVCASEKEVMLIAEPSYNLSKNHGITINPFTVDRPLKDGDTVMLGESEIRFMLTPGHTMGSGCYIVDDSIFSGDTLFCTSVGRTDFPTSSMRDMMQSVARLKNLEGDYDVYPGHDVFTTLGRERKYNPFMR